MREAYEEVDGSYQFTKTLVVYRTGSEIHHAALKARPPSSSKVNREELVNDILIPSTAYNPPFSPKYTLAPDPLPQNAFVKKPRLTSYDRIHEGPQPNQIADSVLMEVEVCEILKQHPHPNVATYLGCQVSDGRITGICFTKYSTTLRERVNPRGLNKRMSRASRDKTEDYSAVLRGVESGIRHLHSLGLVHNDINPSNIMLDGDAVVIIDFGSCRRQGESMGDVGGTYEWCDESVKLSLPQNDLNALEEIRIWLGDGTEEFQFAE